MKLIERVFEVTVTNGSISGKFRLVGRMVEEFMTCTVWEAQDMSGAQRSGHALGFVDALEEGAVQCGYAVRGIPVAALKLEESVYRETELVAR